MRTDAQQQRLSRREVLALPLLPFALLPVALLPAAGEREDEILLVDGWVLRRADLARL